MAEPPPAPGPGPAPAPGPEPEPVSAEAVLRELNLFELRCEEPDRLAELCHSHGLDAVALANELLAFATSRDLPPQLDPPALDAFEHEVLAKRPFRAPPKQDPPRAVPPPLQGLAEEEEEEEAEAELLDVYSPPQKAPQKRTQPSPGPPRAKRPPPGGLLAPRPCPSPKYLARGGRGEVVASFGSWGPSWRGLGGAHSCTPKLFGPPQGHLAKSYKFMFQSSLEVHQALSEQLLELGEALRTLHGLEDFAPVGVPAQGAQTLLGRVVAPGGGRLSLSSVLLEGPPPRGGCTPLDLSQLQHFSLYPGQVVALEGSNPSGSCLLVSKIYEGAPLPSHCPPPEPLPPLQVVVASGPFSLSSDLSYQPLEDLLGALSLEPPDLLLLFGPFLDASHGQVESCQLQSSFGDLFRHCLRTILEGTRSCSCQVVVVPSARDLPHDSVYPQPPLPRPPDLPPEDSARLHLVPDPCTLDLGGVILGLTSSDILLHLASEELCSSPGHSDRFTRILTHILTQRSYYPLYPPSEELNVDLPRLAAFGRLPLTPHVLIAPSRLRFFLREVLGCLCLNPGRLTQGQAGGTFGRLCLQRPPEGSSERQHSPCRAAQVLRI